jgi:4-amino-4-deoxy-L-arabinose transferase-like glycosyltransferase
MDPPVPSTQARHRASARDPAAIDPGSRRSGGSVFSAASCAVLAVYLVLVLVATQALWIGPIKVSCALLAILLSTLGPRLGFARLSGGMLSLLFVGLAALWTAASPVVLTSDFAEYFTLASRFSREHSGHALAESRSPLSTLYYGVAFWLFQPSVTVASAAAIMLWSLQPLCLTRLAQAVGLSPASATLAGLLYALCPAILCFSPLPSSESLFSLLLLLSLWTGVRAIQSPSLLTGLLFGLTLGAAQLSRSNALLFVAPLGLVFLLRLLTPPLRQHRLQVAAITALALLLPLLVQLYLNVSYNHRVSFATSPYGAYNLLAGTSRDSLGRWNQADVYLSGYDQIIDRRPESLARAQAKAVKLAMQRVTDQPLSFLGFALTKKLRVLWSGDPDAIFWSRGGYPAPSDPRWLHAIKLACEVYAVLFLLFTLLGVLLLLRDSFRPDAKQRWGLLVLCWSLLLVAASHLLVEVQPRYHWPLYPLMAILAAYGSSRLPAIGIPRHERSVP